MLDNFIMKKKLVEIINALDAQQYSKAKDICVNTMEYCSSNEFRRSSRIVKRNRFVAKELAREVYRLTQGGMSGRKLEDWLRVEENLGKFI